MGSLLYALLVWAGKFISNAPTPDVRLAAGTARAIDLTPTAKSVIAVSPVAKPYV